MKKLISLLLLSLTLNSFASGAGLVTAASRKGTWEGKVKATFLDGSTEMINVTVKSHGEANAFWIRNDGKGIDVDLLNSILMITEINADGTCRTPEALFMGSGTCTQDVIELGEKFESLDSSPSKLGYSTKLNFQGDELIYSAQHHAVVNIDEGKQDIYFVEASGTLKRTSEVGMTKGVSPQ